VVRPSGGDRMVDRWTLVAWEGVNILLTYRTLEICKKRAQELDTPTRTKLREVLELVSSRQSLEEVLIRKEPYPYRHLGYRRFGKEESRVFDSRTREIVSHEGRLR
jgi:hypothetical protein